MHSALPECPQPLLVRSLQLVEVRPYAEEEEVIACDNIQKAEVLGSHFSRLFAKENNVSYSTGNLITSHATFMQLISQFNVEIILDKLTVKYK